MTPFAHLHTHSEFSALDGLQRMDAMCAAAAADAQTAIAVTDHGTLGGAVAFAKAADKAGIKAIGGIEFYVSIGSRFEQNDLISTSEFEGGKIRRYQHLTALAADRTGWTNLVRLNNAAADSVWYKPRVDFDLLAQHGDGLILGTGCLGGPVAGALAEKPGDEGFADAVAATARLLEIVGGDKDRLFVEVMDHGIEAERVVLPGLARIAKHFGLRVVATNDAHYTCEDDCGDHDRWLAIGVNKPFDNPDRFRFNGSGYHLRTFAEMSAVFEDTDLFGGQNPVTNSALIAEQVDGTLSQFLPTGRMRLPKFPVPASVQAQFERGERHGASTPQQLLLYLRVREGSIARYGHPLPQPVKDRLRFEMDVINGFGFEDYFLIVSELTDWVREQGKMSGPGRGSAAGSCLAYSLQITDVDPLAHGLLFERFLDVTRKGMPDIDLDFPMELLDDAVEHLESTYGKACVARIGTNGSKQAKAVVRDIARLSGQPSLGAKLAELVPQGMGLGLLMDPQVADGKPLRALIESDEAAASVVQQARAIEATKSVPGIHACGVIVSDEPLTDVVPLRRDTKSGALVTTWEAGELEGFGYLKLDRLGLRNLDIITRAVDMIAADTGERIDTHYGALPMDPGEPRAAKAWSMLQAGKTDSVFQLESDGMRKLVAAIAPDNLDDLSAAVALYRPGPLGAGMHTRFADRKNGREQASYDYLTTNPAEQAELASVLDKSYGVIVVQEDLMALSRVVAGFGPGRRNRLRKAFSKKIAAEMQALKSEFFAGGMAATLDDPENDTEASIPFARKTIDELWRTFEASASYLFNACISGGTVLDSSLGLITVEDLYVRMYGTDTDHTGDADLRDAVHAGQVRLLALNEAKVWIESTPMRDIHCNGTKPVRRFTFNDGTSVTSTLNHRWLTATGYATADQIEVGLRLVGGHPSFGGQIYYRTVTGIEDVSSQMVYDVEMAEGTDHNFLANGIVSHNSHSAPYAYIAYITAFLKANWPAHYAAAQLSVTDDDARRLAMLYSLRSEGVSILGPDINTAAVATSVDDQGRVVLGLGEIAGVKDNAAHLVAERETNGPFASLADLAARAVMPDGRSMPVSILEALICAGACDQFGPRRGLMTVVRCVRSVPDLPVPDIEWSIIERAARERQTLGVVVGEPPLKAFGAQIASWKPGPSGGRLTPVHHLVPDEYATTVGVLSGWSIARKAGRSRANFTLEGTHGAIGGVIWHDKLEAILAGGVEPRVGDIVAIRAKVKARFAKAEAAPDEVAEPDGMELVAFSVSPLPIVAPARDLAAVTDPIRWAGDDAADPEPAAAAAVEADEYPDPEWSAPPPEHEEPEVVARVAQPVMHRATAPALHAVPEPAQRPKLTVIQGGEAVQIAQVVTDTVELELSRLISGMATRRVPRQIPGLSAQGVRQLQSLIRDTPVNETVDLVAHGLVEPEAPVRFVRRVADPTGDIAIS